MLTLYDEKRHLGRRDFLKIGGLGFAGCSLLDVLAAQASAKTASQRTATGKSVIFLFMHGGPSQIETFDPKMSAPAGIRSATGEVKTSLPGVTFGGTFPKLASRANRLAVVRSFTTGDGRHDIKPIVCRDTLNANLGSLYARVVGANHPVSGMPTNAALFPRAVAPECQKETSTFGNFRASGDFGSAYAPFAPGDGGDLQQDMQLNIPLTRLDARRALLGQLDSAKRAIENERAMSDMQHQAFQIILGGVADAFDLSKEDPRTVARYDTAPLVRPDQISRRWNNYNNYVDNAKSLGKLLLLARRLCEAGCGFVTVTTNFVWDMHADVNNATVQEGMGYMGAPFDHAVATLIDDLYERGLDDKILLVACGEMGRTPKINKNGGRDHWGGSAPLLFSGGGLRMGQVIGQSTRDASAPLSTPYKIPHLVSTVMNTAFNVNQLRIARGAPAEVVRAASQAEPIFELF